MTEAAGRAGGRWALGMQALGAQGALGAREALGARGRAAGTGAGAGAPHGTARRTGAATRPGGPATTQPDPPTTRPHARGHGRTWARMLGCGLCTCCTQPFFDPV